MHLQLVDPWATCFLARECNQHDRKVHLSLFLSHTISTQSHSSSSSTSSSVFWRLVGAGGRGKPGNVGSGAMEVARTVVPRQLSEVAGRAEETVGRRVEGAAGSQLRQQTTQTTLRGPTSPHPWSYPQTRRRVPQILQHTRRGKQNPTCSHLSSLFFYISRTYTHPRSHTHPHPPTLLDLVLWFYSSESMRPWVTTSGVLSICFNNLCPFTLWI